MIQIIINLARLIKRLISSEKSPVKSQTINSNNKKPNIKLLLASTNLNNSIIDLDNYVSALCEWGHNLSALSYPQKVLYFNQELEREVNNGGFWQYFRNTSGNFANDTIKTLRDIDANKTSKILESAIEMFPDKKVPTDKDLRNRIIDDIEDDAKEKWNELDKQFFKYEDNLNKLNIEFVRKNIRHF
jgi:hypothetical protein